MTYGFYSPGQIKRKPKRKMNYTRLTMSRAEKAYYKKWAKKHGMKEKSC